MNKDDQNFESLRRLLAFKRYETPPPGYFNNFSGQVIVRIRAGEAQQPAALFVRMPWLVRWLEIFEAKPVFAGGFATGLCLLLLFGAVMAQRPEVVSQNFLQPVARNSVDSVNPAQMQAPLGAPVNQIMIADNSTNPIINFQNESIPFGPMPVSAQLASFSIPNN